MPAWWMLALQVVAGPAAPVERAPSERTCPAGRAGDDIVVCARPNDRFRLKPLAGQFQAERTPPKAETAINGVGTVAVEAERAADAQGAPINRAMIRLRVPIGGKKR